MKRNLVLSMAVRVMSPPVAKRGWNAPSSSVVASETTDMVLWDLEG